MRIRLNHPFNIESILDDLVNYRVNIIYDGIILSGYLTQDFDKKAGKIRYLIVDGYDNVDTFIDLGAIRKLDIVT
ncbi:MAG: hypothetical protein R2685_10975 [Candidatus Nitrosocosmicus sp.]|nr:hypothetical protein [Candidatus Nitrosocosmicus sp.]